MRYESQESSGSSAGPPEHRSTGGTEAATDGAHPEAPGTPELVTPGFSVKASPREPGKSSATGPEAGGLDQRFTASAKLGPLFELAPEPLWKKHLEIFSRGQFSSWIDLKAGSAKLEFLGAEVGAHGIEASLLDADFTAFKANVGAIWGDWLGGIISDLSLTLGQGTGKFGLKEGSLAIELGFAYATLRHEIGGNILGINVTVFGEISAGGKYGVSAGETTSVHDGFLGVGVTFGFAKSPDPRGDPLHFSEDAGNASANYLTNPIFGNGSPYFW
jgi:hypothetical protein